MLGTDRKLMAFVATKNAERAKAFYTNVLGLRFVADEPFALVFDDCGTMLRIQKAGEVTPAPYTALGWEVPDIVAAMQALASKKVTFERFPGFDQDRAGMWTAPGTTTKIAWFKDPDGNLLSLTQF